MAEQTVLVAIDIGTTKVCVLIGEMAARGGVDGQEGVRDPIGMTAVRLEVETHIVTASSTSVQNLTKCVQRAGVEIDELVLAPLATAEATLNDEDRELGVCLADIGGDTTDVAIFQDGSISHCATIPMGGRSVTADLGIVLRVTP